MTSFSRLWSSKDDKQDNYLRLRTMEEDSVGVNMQVTSMRLFRLPLSCRRSRILLLTMLLALALLNTVDFLPSPTSRGLERLLQEEKENIDTVLDLDLSVAKNVRATLQSARSWAAWEGPPPDDWKWSLSYLQQFNPMPLSSTVDRRPLIVRRQLNWDKLNQNQDGSKLGCAFSTNTFVANLDQINTSGFNQGTFFSNWQSTCTLCFQFATPLDMYQFLPEYGDNFEVMPSSEKCFSVTGQVTARFANWQQSEEERFEGFGYPFQVDCSFPNGYKELTCDSISRLYDSSVLGNGAVQKVSLETKFSLETKIERNIQIFSSWPWEALRSHDDDREHIAKGLPRTRDDQNSAFVPSNPKELRLAHVVGPTYSRDDEGTDHGGNIKLESMLLNPGSHGGIHKRFADTIVHLSRLAPNSIHMIAVVDGQAHQTYNKLKEMLSKTLLELFPVHGKYLASNYERFQNEEYFSIDSMFQGQSILGANSDLTLRDLLQARNIKIKIVPLTTPSITFEKSICANQYAFTSYLAARYAADFDAMMYIDADGAFLETSGASLKEVIYNQFFAKNTSSGCIGYRFPLIEQYLEPENDSPDKAFQCVHEMASNPARYNFMVKNCNLKEGHILARTDSVLQFNVHFVDSLKQFLLPDQRICNGIETLMDSQQMIEIHVRDRLRKPVCTCQFMSQIG